jgi:hypothetical protein
MRVRSMLVVMAAAIPLAVATPSGAQTAPPTPSPYPPQPPYVNGSCFWGPALDWHVPEFNQAAPDTVAIYWYVKYQVPPGATITLKGNFPHARYMSFTTYKTVDGEPGVENTFTTDVDIAPDPGSENPFLNGVPRTTPNRGFTLTLSPQPPPAGEPAPNTLYTGTEGMTDQVQTVELIERIYVPDHYPQDLAGGEPLPAPTMTRADGTTIDGQALCNELGVVTGLDKLGRGGMPDNVYLRLRDAGPPFHPGTIPVVWDKYFNTSRVLVPLMRDTIYAPLIPSLPSETVKGFYANPGNSYVFSYVDRRLGPDPDGHNVLVLKAKMPLTPVTWDGNLFADNAGAQVRYWSLCNYGSSAVAVNAPANTDCLFDEQVPLDAARNYTIVVSLAADRPANARTECGVAWMDWTLKGDQMGDHFLDFLMIRNMLASPDFANSVQAIQTPDTVQTTMGPYYPQGQYMSPTQFDIVNGCGLGRDPGAAG